MIQLSNGLYFLPRHPKATLEHMGLIPEMLHDYDPRSAKEQLHDGYAHGGGWRPFSRFTMDSNECLCYPGDPPQRPIAELRLRDERIVLYEHAWVAVIQPDGSYEVCRMD